MDQTPQQAETTLTGLFAGLPRWARVAVPAILLAECAALGAGLLRERAPESVRIELSSARPAPGFTAL